MVRGRIMPSSGRLQKIGVNVRTSEHGLAVYERYKFTSPYGPDDVIEDPMVAMREIIEAEGYKVNAIVVDQEIIRAALLGHEPPVPESIKRVVGRPLLFGEWMHEVYPWESYWFVDNGT
jgi:hypothetical protein